MVEGVARFSAIGVVGVAAALAGCRTAPFGETDARPGASSVRVEVSRPRYADVVLVGGAGDLAGADASSAGTPPPPTETLPPAEVRAGRPSPGYGLGYGPGTVAPTAAPRAWSQTSLSDRVGPNAQPLWTTHRRFSSTRAYVLSPWQVEFESWWRGRFRKDDTEQHRFQEEIGIGLPHRFQLDLYWNIIKETDEDTRYRDVQVEGRWALAPWDGLPLNPTVYAEWKFQDDAPDVAEAKILLADDIGCRWTWAFNAFVEQEMGGAREREMGFSQALSYTLIDPQLSVGAEMIFQHTTERGSRDDPEIGFLLGPSIQWRPSRRVHLDVAPLFGLTDDSPDLEIYVVFGIDLAGGSSHAVSAPTSVRSR